MTYARITAAKAATPATAMEPPKVLAEPVKAMGDWVGLMAEPVPAATPETRELAPAGLAGAELAPAGEAGAAEPAPAPAAAELAPAGEALAAEVAPAWLFRVTVDTMVVGMQVLMVTTETAGDELAGLAGAAGEDAAGEAGAELAGLLAAGLELAGLAGAAGEDEAGEAGAALDC